jgi:hypothetical protein
MRVLKLCVCVCLAAGGLAVAAGNAIALQSPGVDCQDHGYKLTRHYTVPQLQHALATLPAQISEYTPCAQVIQAQLNAQLNVTGTSTTVKAKSGGSSLSGVLIGVIVVIVLAGGALAYLASRRSAGGADGEDGDGAEDRDREDRGELPPPPADG